MSNLIITCVDNNNVLFLCEFISSLKDLGAFLDKVYVLSYGIDETIQQKLSQEAIFIPCATSPNDLIWHRLIDLIPFLEEHKEDKIALFDADIWFQSDINPLFDKIENKVYFSCERNYKNLKNTPIFFENNYLKDDKDIIRNNLFILKERYSGYINGGFIAGKGEILLNKFKKYQNLIDDGTLRKDYGSDQVFYNIDIEDEDASLVKYNTLLSELVGQNGIFFNVTSNGSNLEKTVGIHSAGDVFNENLNTRENLFRFCYPNSFNKFIKEKEICEMEINEEKNIYYVYKINQSSKELFVSSKKNYEYHRETNKLKSGVKAGRTDEIKMYNTIIINFLSFLQNIPIEKFFDFNSFRDIFEQICFLHDESVESFFKYIKMLNSMDITTYVETDSESAGLFIVTMEVLVLLGKKITKCISVQDKTMPLLFDFFYRWKNPAFVYIENDPGKVSNLIRSLCDDKVDFMYFKKPYNEKTINKYQPFCKIIKIKAEEQ